MIFKRSLLQELFSTALSSLQVPLGVMATQRITYSPGYAARDDVASSQHQKPSILIAKEGSHAPEKNGAMCLTPMNDRDYESEHDTSGFGAMEFVRYTLQTGPAEAKHETHSSKSKSSSKLFRERSPDIRVGLAMAAVRTGLGLSGSPALPRWQWATK
jgi:hypothetical protein